MPRTECLSAAELAAFHLGELPEPELIESGDHLEACPLCQQAAQALDGLADETLAAYRASALAAPLPAASARPERVGAYTILEEIGRGGMGVVYRARHSRLHRVVALKMLLSDCFADREQRLRFRAEAEAVARLLHPHIVQLFEIGEHAGQTGPPCPFLCLEFVEGGNLAQRLAGRLPGPAQAAAWLEPLARAAHAAHEHGIIHRDLKPANILLGRDGQPKICDFGVAKIMTGSDLKTLSGMLVGTAEYMAPEQAAGKSDATPATDVYALGAILYEMLTGKPPFKGASTLDTLNLVRQVEPVPPRRLQPRLPRDLETICLKCLRKEPARRYASALELAEDLGRFRAGRPIQARPVGRWERAWRWCRRNPALAATGAAALVALAATVIVSVSYAVSENRHAHDLGLVLRQSEQHRERAEYRLAESYLDRGVSLCESGELGGGLLWLARSLQVAPKDAADLTAVIRANLAGWHGQLSELTAVLVFQDTVKTTAFSPDGRLLLTTTEAGAAQLWDVATGQPLAGPFVHQGPLPAAFSPDSKWVCTMDGGQVKLRNATTGKPGAALAQPGGVVALAFSPDGKRILTAGADQSARLWTADAGTAIGEPLRHSSTIAGVAFSPDGRLALIWGGNAFQIAAGRLPMDDSRPNPPLASADLPAPIQAAAFSPDSRMLVTGSADGMTQFWNVAGAKPLGEPLRHAGPVTLVAFSPDGKVLLTGCRGHPWTGCRLWDAGARQPVGAALAHAAKVWSVAFSPDSKFLVAGGHDNAARLWDLADGEQRGQPLQHRNQIHHLAVSPDGAAVLTGGIDGVARLWQSASGKLLATVVEVGHVKDLAFSSTGTAFFIRDMTNVIRLYQPPRPTAPGPTLPHHDSVTAMAFSPDGARAVTASGSSTQKHGEIRVWETANGRPLTAPLKHPFRPRAVAFSPDGRLVAAAGGHQSLDAGAQLHAKGEIRLWEAASGQPFGRVLEHPEHVHAVAFSPDGRTLATGCDDRLVRRWDAASGTLVGGNFVHASRIKALAWSPAGGLIVSGDKQYRAHLWDVADEQRRGHPMNHIDDILAIAVGPGGRVVLTASDDGTARLWDAQSGEPLGPPLRHTASIGAAAFSPDGRRACCGGSAAARLWDVVTSRPIGPPLPHQGSVIAVCFKPDGQTLVTANRDLSKNNVHIHTWPIPHPLDGDVEEIIRWIQVKTGMELDAAGAVRNLDPDAWGEKKCQDPFIRPPAVLIDHGP